MRWRSAADVKRMSETPHQTEGEDPESPPIAVFAATWGEAAASPDASSARGWRTHEVSIYPTLIVAEPNRIASTLRIPRVEYRWPAVVLERHRLLHHGDLLVERDDHIVRLALSGTYEQARDALIRAGFEVVEVMHYGWSEPLSIPRSEIRGFEKKLPHCMLAPFDQR
jgi:hypothetical protein